MLEEADSEIVNIIHKIHCRGKNRAYACLESAGVFTTIICILPCEVSHFPHIFKRVLRE